MTLRDIEVDSQEDPSMIKIHLKGSKPDQTRRGMDLHVGKIGNKLCPVAAILAYLVVRGRDNGPLFRQKNGSPLSHQHLVQVLRYWLTAAGMDCSRYSGHSFRIGAATTAIARGVPESIVQTLGRWESDSFKRYIRIPRQDLAADIEANGD